MACGKFIFLKKKFLLKKVVLCIALLSTMISVIACGNNRPEIPLTTVDADTLLYDRGVAALDEGDWRTAREYFLQIRDNYPQSTLQPDARLGVADSYEAEATLQSYMTALADFRDFIALYPTHPRAQYAQFKVGMVYFHQMRRPERDQVETRNAITEFELFEERYPGSELLDEVQDYLRQAYDRLSEANYVVGKFYHRINWHPGAIDRLEMMLRDDPNFSQRDLVYYYLADSLQYAGRSEESLPLLEKLIAEFPESEIISDAHELMAQIETNPEDPVDFRPRLRTQDDP